MSVLVDSSVWIDYFRDVAKQEKLDFLIEQNLVSTNELILAELIPALQVRRQQKVIDLLKEIKCHSFVIDWNDLMQIQIICLRNGINGVGIPDLIIAQHSIQNNLELYTHDRHFKLIANHTKLSLYE